MTTKTLVWFRNDLRIHDNPALHAASLEGSVVPVFVWDPKGEGEWAPGAASRWWLHHSLRSLGERLAAMGGRLILRQGLSVKAILALAAESGANAVFWNRRYEPHAREQEASIERALTAEGVRVQTFNAGLLFDPEDICNQQGGPYRVFTPFWNAVLRRDAIPPPAPDPASGRFQEFESEPASLLLDDLELLRPSHIGTGFRNAWIPGESVALKELENFLEHRIDDYDSRRDRPDLEGVSRFSPRLRFGELGPRQIWNTIAERGAVSASAVAFQRQIAWREFAHHLLYHFPHTATQPLRPEFADFPWQHDPLALRVWGEGRTGYPIVDAGMRQLLETGWMHNRVRMIVASFLVKDLMIPWQEGAKFFWDKLVDADLANNTFGWQWTAGCGADAAPYFRVFNPSGQGERFDPEGAYVRRWVPELRDLPASVIHRPWEAASIDLKKRYPSPIVDHRRQRDLALAAYAGMKTASGGKTSARRQESFL